MGLRMPRPTKASNGIWQYRVRVPDDVAESVGRDVIKESLHTRDEAEAIKRFTIRHAESLAGWDKHRTKLTSPRESCLIKSASPWRAGWARGLIAVAVSRKSGLAPAPALSGKRAASLLSPACAGHKTSA